MTPNRPTHHSTGPARKAVQSGEFRRERRASRGPKLDFSLRIQRCSTPCLLILLNVDSMLLGTRPAGRRH